MPENITQIVPIEARVSLKSVLWNFAASLLGSYTGENLITEEPIQATAIRDKTDIVAVART